MTRGQQAPKNEADRARTLKRKNRGRLKELMQVRQFYINKRLDYLPEAYKKVMQNINTAVKSDPTL